MLENTYITSLARFKIHTPRYRGRVILTLEVFYDSLHVFKLISVCSSLVYLTK